MLTFVLYIGVCLLYRGFRNIEVRYFEVPFCPIYFSVTFARAKEYRSLYRGLRYIEVREIEFLLKLFSP